VCGECADNLGGIDLTDDTEKAHIHYFVEASLNRLKGDDRALPQLHNIRALLRRGIGVHHGGLLPIVKEVP
jgi:antiviral helicase SKI2